MEKALARFTSLEVFATVPVINGFIKDAPTIKTARKKITEIFECVTPRKKYPIVNNPKASIKPFLKPILSLMAPENGGRKYKKPANNPLIVPLITSENPTRSVR